MTRFISNTSSRTDLRQKLRNKRGYGDGVFA